MTKRTDEMYLADMLQYAREARALTAGETETSFVANRTLQLALTYLVQIVGEAATQMSDEARAALPDLPWARMRGMRHRLVHNYGRVGYDLVWDVIENDLPLLIAALEKIIPPEPPSA
jgi:uncharacterized protein with HEPN domain